MKNEIIVLKANLLGGMNDYILNEIGDEEIFDTWFALGVPDGADEDELISIAQDDAEFRRICGVFGSLIEDYQ